MEKSSPRKRPWKRILAILACLLIVIGIAPPAALFFGGSHSFFPLQMPLPLKPGEYASQFFKTELDDTYEIEVTTDDYPAQQVQMDLDWKIVDDTGSIIEQGTYSGRIDSGYETIGEYRPKPGLRQRIIVQIQNVIQATGKAHPQLLIGLPQRNSDYCDARDIFNAWAYVTAGPGAILLLFLLIRRIKRSREPLAPPNS
jgi:hypothetical protein